MVHRWIKNAVGVFGHTLNIKQSYNLGQHATDLQSELFAVVLKNLLREATLQRSSIYTPTAKPPSKKW